MTCVLKQNDNSKSRCTKAYKTQKATLIHLRVHPAVAQWIERSAVAESVGFWRVVIVQIETDKSPVRIWPAGLGVL